MAGGVGRAATSTQPCPAPVPAGRAGEPAGGPLARARVGRRAALAERAHLGEEYERYQRARPARLSAAELAAIRALAAISRRCGPRRPRP